MSRLCLSYNISILFFIVIVTYTLQKNRPPVTLSVQEHVELLKVQIADQIREKQHRSELIKPINDGDDYQYVDIQNRPMTPINEFDERKKDNKFELRELVTPPTTEMEDSPMRLQKPIKRVRKKKRGKKKNRVMRPVETFYRRRIYNEDILYSPMKLLHCQELFTPILAGYRKNISTYKTGPVKSNNVQVKRITHLLGKNTSRYTREEVTSLLYQLSNIPMRLFEFDLDAVKAIIDVILKGRPHTWHNLKASVQDMIENWKLDLSNTSTLLNQAKIYRPPCVTTTGYEGSTKTSSGVKYSKITSSKTTCAAKMEKKRAYDYDDYDERLYH